MKYYWAFLCKSSGVALFFVYVAGNGAFLVWLAHIPDLSPQFLVYFPVITSVCRRLFLAGIGSHFLVCVCTWWMPPAYKAGVSNFEQTVKAMMNSKLDALKTLEFLVGL